MNEDREDGLHNMSVVPYDSHRDVVLRNANSIVYRDPTSKQLIARDPNRRIELRSDRQDHCPTCHQPWPHSPVVADHSEGAPDLEEQPNFIDRDYFRMLAQSLPGSAQPSAPPSPRRRLAQPVRVTGSAPHNHLPPDAQFVGSSPAPPSQAHGISESAFAPKYFEKFFVVEKELGRGGRGVVLLVKHMLDGVTLGQFACKRVPIGDDHAWLEKVLVEVQLLQTLSHQNLVSYRHVWLEDFQLNTFGPSVPCAFILQQYCNGGDMHNYVCGTAQASTTTQELKERIRRRSRGETEMPRRADEPKKLGFDQIYSFFRDITAGLRFLHLNDFVHRDLKPSNCLLHTAGHETRVLVSDFGEVQYEYATREVDWGNRHYLILRPRSTVTGLPDGPYGNFTFKSDIFSLGMILHFLCFAHLPYRFADVLHEEREDIDLLRAEITSWRGFDDQRKLRPELPDKLYAFLKRLLSLNPDHRPTAEEVLSGIRTGGLEEPLDLRRRNSMATEELTPGRRVQPVDSPMRRESPTGSQERQGSGTNASGISRLVPSQLRKRQLSRDLPNIDTQPNGHDHGHNPTGSTTHYDDSIHSKPHSQDMIIHSPLSSSRPTSQSPPSQPPYAASPAAATTAPSLRAAHESPGLSLRSRSLRIFLLSLKLLSVLQPCTAPGLSIDVRVAYPLMTLAMAEMTVGRWRVWMALLGVLAHVGVMAVLGRYGGVCLVADVGWERD